jgi:tetratricopeptide (TPR) repeat protein
MTAGKGERFHMKTMNWKIRTILTAVFPLLFSGIVCSCATPKQDWKRVGDYGNLSQPAKSSMTGNQVRPRAEAPARYKALPEMSAEDYEASGDLCLGNKDYTMAFVQYEKSLALKPDNPRIYYKQGLIFLETGKPEDAVDSFQKMLEREPDQALVYQGIGTAFFKMRKYDVAEKHFLKAVELEPALWKARNYLGNIYDFQKKFDKAAREYAEAIRVRPDEGVLYNNLGVSLFLAARYDESINAFKEALWRKGPKERAYNNLGLVLAKTGRYGAALDAFMKGTGSAQAYNNLGCVYMSQGEYPEAAQAFNKAIELSPTFYEKANENLKKIQLEAFTN